MKFSPWDYQQFAINHVMDHETSGLFLDMGMGKTVSTLTAISNLILLGDVNKVLVIAPLRVAEDTWSTECEKWEHLHDLKISKILGPKMARLRALKEDADIYIINRENVPWLVQEIGKTWSFDMCVIDELSSFKSSKAQRFRELKKVRPYFKYIVGLTGTPAPNSLIDLWPQVYLLDGGKRLGKTITGYRQQYFYPEQANGHIVYKYGLKPGADEAIEERISDICISMKACDHLNMPERMDNIIPVNIDKTKYKELQKELVAEIGGEDITVANAAVLSNKLLQMANGAIYTESKEVIELHDAKLDALAEIIECNEGKPLLCFYSFKSDCERIMKKFKHAKKLESSEDIKAWNEGKIQLLLLHPASAGHGLNLQYGGSIVVWFGLTWSLELYQQANARLYRQGQKDTVIINHIVAKGTVDEDVIKALQQKKVGQDKLLEAVKARILQVEN